MTKSREALGKFKDKTKQPTALEALATHRAKLVEYAKSEDHPAVKAFDDVCHELAQLK